MYSGTRDIWTLLSPLPGDKPAGAFVASPGCCRRHLRFDAASRIEASAKKFLRSRRRPAAVADRLAGPGLALLEEVDQLAEALLVREVAQEAPLSALPDQPSLKQLLQVV
jgi:hypothetical protein